MFGPQLLVSPAADAQIVQDRTQQSGNCVLSPPGSVTYYGKISVIGL